MTGSKAARVTPPKNIRLLIADYQTLVRDALRVLLETKGFLIVAEASNGPNVLQEIRNTSPDVVLLDVAMPKLDGIEVTKRIRDQFPKVRVLALAPVEGEHVVREAMAAGAAGYVPKCAFAADLIEAIGVVATGKRYVHARAVPALRAAPAVILSPREGDVVRLLAHGFAQKEIASQMGVSVKTVDTHKRRVMQKLGVTSRVGLVKYAVAKGWILEAETEAVGTRA
jgi:DNA-binding NarL/FixJ family response regulator